MPDEHIVTRFWNLDVAEPDLALSVPERETPEYRAPTATHRLFAMSPTVLRDGPFRLFFFSREEERMHVHVAHPDGEAKFWLDPTIALAAVVGLTPKLAGDAETIVRRHEQEVRDAWKRHFGG